MAEPLGLHLEGPLIAPDRRGAHPTGFLRRPDDPDVGWDRWTREAGVAPADEEVAHGEAG